MSKPILVGYDPRTLDPAPVRFGAAAARFTGARLIIASVHARASEGDGRASEQIDEDLAADVAETNRALGEIERELAGEGIPVECQAMENASAPRALHEAADGQGAGLLVVGSTGRGPLGRVLPGSTAERLMHGAPCPIAVVPHGWQAGGGLEVIGVAYVDTDEGREALRGAHALARRAGATLRVLTAVRVRLAMYGETEARTAGQRGKDFDEVEGEYRLRAEAAARAAIAELDGDIAVEVDAFVEDPADVLIRVSENLDLLVCGSRAYGPLRAVLLGGVSRRVAADARCPVIVLPRGVESSLEALLPEAPGATAQA
jgi:nucleotide-binding universal stress UspA family protein